MKSKVFNFIFVVTIILILTKTYITKENKLFNPVWNMTSTITNEIDIYDTDYIYNENIPSTAEPKVIEKGVNGLRYTYDGLNYKTLSLKKNEVVEKGTGKAGEYVGKLTGYGPDCPGCSVVGNVSCLTREGVKHSLINDGIYYEDVSFGKVRILAADQREFPCGTIVKVDSETLDEFYGIVIDTGVTMRNAYSKGIIWMDLAFSKESETGKVTSSNTKFSVQRWGW